MSKHSTGMLKGTGVRMALVFGGAAVVLGLAGCATETNRVVAATQTQAAIAQATAPVPVQQRVSVSIGKFENQSAFMRGAFSDGVDRVGNQAKTALIAHLTQTGRFTAMDRENMSEIRQETSIAGGQLSLKGARFVVSGHITEMGRKEVGDKQLFGILGRGKEQVAYAKVMINVTDVQSGAVVASAQGAGEYALAAREVLGFGGTAGYDSTLVGKVIDLAIRQAVDDLVKGLDVRRWAN